MCITSLASPWRGWKFAESSFLLWRDDCAQSSLHVTLPTLLVDLWTYFRTLWKSTTKLNTGKYLVTSAYWCGNRQQIWEHSSPACKTLGNMGKPCETTRQHGPNRHCRFRGTQFWLTQSCCTQLVTSKRAESVEPYVLLRNGQNGAIELGHWQLSQLLRRHEKTLEDGSANRCKS